MKGGGRRRLQVGFWEEREGRGLENPSERGSGGGHHSSWPGLRTLGGLICPITPCEWKAWQLLPHNPGFPRVRGGSQGAAGPFLKPCPSGAELLSWSEGWATYGSGSNLCCRLLAACCPHILWVLTPTSSPQGLGNPQTVAIQTCSGTTLHEKINIYIYILFCLFLKKEKKGGGRVSWVSSVSPH